MAPRPRPHPQVLTLNKRIQKQNNAPLDFPSFVREGFDIKVLGEGYQVDDTGWVDRTGGELATGLAKLAVAVGAAACQHAQLRASLQRCMLPCTGTTRLAKRLLLLPLLPGVFQGRQPPQAACLAGPAAPCMPGGGLATAVPAAPWLHSSLASAATACFMPHSTMLQRASSSSSSYCYYYSAAAAGLTLPPPCPSSQHHLQGL
jgi:hypothetical protein